MKMSELLMELCEGSKLDIIGNFGYVIAANPIRRCLRVSDEEKMLLLEIIGLVNDSKGYAFPSQQTLAMALGKSSSSISRLLKRLEKKGFISTRGGRGGRKIYYPCVFHNNPYIVVSEWFHFATKAIHENVPESQKATWGDQLLAFVNIKVKEEFTQKDGYGKFISMLLQNADKQKTRDNFLLTLTDYVSEIVGQPIVINWADDIKAQNDRKRTKKQDPSYATRRPKTKLGIAVDLSDDPYKFENER